jgi:type I restriction enzyme S subunit
MKGTDRSVLPSHWELATMGEIATVVGGSTPKSKQPEYWGGDVPWLGVSDLTGYSDKYISHGARSITEAGYASCSTQLVPTGTVLFSSRAPIGYVAIASQPVCTSQGFKSFVLADGVSPEYIYWYLKYAKSLAESLASGTTFRELSATAAAALPVPIPPPREQLRIVEALEHFLNRIDEAARGVHIAREHLHTFHKSVLTAAVSGELDAGVEKTESAHELLETILDAREQRWLDCGMGRHRPPEGPVPGDFALPPSWTWATVDQLAVGVQYGSSAKTDPDLVEGVPVLRMGNIVAGRLDLDNLKYLPRTHEEFPALLLRDGDLLFNRTNSPELVGKTAVARGLPAQCSFASYIIRVRLAPEVLPDFVSYFINSPFGRRWVRDNVSQQVGQANVNGSKLRALTLPLPPRLVQERIVAAVEAARASAEQLASALLNASTGSESLRTSLMHQAFTGQLAQRDAATNQRPSC